MAPMWQSPFRICEIPAIGGPFSRGEMTVGIVWSRGRTFAAWRSAFLPGINQFSREGNTAGLRRAYARPRLD